MQLTHRQIEVFRAVMVSGHVTRAAEVLHTSQPTVSRELARLEQVLGIELFERVKGRLRPTVRALALLEEVELSYVGLDRIAATAVSNDSLPVRTIASVSGERSFTCRMTSVPFIPGISRSTITQS